MLMQSHFKGRLEYNEKVKQGILRKRSGQDRNPTPLAERARIATTVKLI